MFCIGPQLWRVETGFSTFSRSLFDWPCSNFRLLEGICEGEGPMGRPLQVGVGHVTMPHILLYSTYAMYKSTKR